MPTKTSISYCRYIYPPYSCGHIPIPYNTISKDLFTYSKILMSLIISFPNF